MRSGGKLQGKERLTEIYAPVGKRSVQPFPSFSPADENIRRTATLNGTDARFLPQGLPYGVQTGRVDPLNAPSQGTRILKEACGRKRNVF